MAYRLPANLHRNRHGRLYFRIVVPEDIRHAVGQREIYRSLNTCAVREAAHAAQTLRIAFWALFLDLRNHLMSDNEAKDPNASRSRVMEIINRVGLEQAEKLHVELERQRADNEKATPRSTMNLMELVERKKEEMRWREEFDELKEELDKEIEGQNEAIRQQKQQQQHERELAIARHSSRSTPAAPNPTGMPLSEAVAEYLAGHKPSTRKTYKGRLDHAVKFFTADKDARHIEQADFSRYAKHTLDTVPNVTTAGFYITTLCGLLNHFRIREGWGPKLTTQTLIPKKQTPDSADRDSFTLDQIAAIFRNAERYRSVQPHKYWVTVATAFLGCRIEELTQVNLHTDLRQTKDAAIWYLDLNANPDPDGVVRKSMKNKASWRCVPIHSALVKLGFVGYLQQEHKAGFSRPFERGCGPLIPKGEAKPKWSHYITNWGGRELEKLKRIEGFATANNRLTYFHSMRHTFSQYAGWDEIHPEICEAIMGHTYSGSERERYHKLKSNPEQLSRGVEMGLADLARLVAVSE